MVTFLCGSAPRGLARRPLQGLVTTTTPIPGLAHLMWIKSRLGAARPPPHATAKTNFRTTNQACRATLPIAIIGRRGQRQSHFETLLDIGPDINPRAALGDKGLRFQIKPRSLTSPWDMSGNPVSMSKDMPAFFPKFLYKGRGRIEQAVGIQGASRYAVKRQRGITVHS